MLLFFLASVAGAVVGNNLGKRSLREKREKRVVPHFSKNLAERGGTTLANSTLRTRGIKTGFPCWHKNEHGGGGGSE